MAHVSQLPCDGDGICMACKQKPPEAENLNCSTCFTPWHVSCLAVRPETLASTLHWECPDCTMPFDGTVAAACGGAIAGSGELVAAVRAIEADASLTEREKARRRQRLVSGRGGDDDEEEEEEREEKKRKGKGKVEEEENDVLRVVGMALNCSFCMQLPERPVTTPCGHNFCLKCFQKWIGQGKHTCAKCRRSIPPKMAEQPRINSALVAAIRTAKMSKSNNSIGSDKVQYYMHNQDRPDKAYTTDRAKRNGKSNAASGKIFVTVPPDYFGPILAENDPERGRGVLVGDGWEGRLECRQWGVHLPPVSGICGQSKHGAQSVVLSGGYQDDEDHGEWFLYTGSGGRDLSGNKRTNKEQSSDQKFESFNEALRVSCKKGYPVRVIRSCKEKSSYAPERGVRYDGIYRIEKCWQKVGKQGFKVCRYLFVRCDNSPAPWTSDDYGDKVRALPTISELKTKATNVTERTESPSWDYDEEEGCWKWKKPPPPSKKQVHANCSQDRQPGRTAETVRKAQNNSLKAMVLKGLSCRICDEVMTLPLTTPCGHNFCKACLEGAFTGQTFERERTCLGGRNLRSQKNVMKCPSCQLDISEFLKNPQVNRELMVVIEGLQDKAEEEADNVEASVEGKGLDSSSGIGENELPQPQAEDELKRKRGDVILMLQKAEKTCKRMRIGAEAAVDEGIDSPSSPLNIRSDEDIQ